VSIRSDAIQRNKISVHAPSQKSSSKGMGGFVFNSFDTGLSPKVSSNQYEPVPLEQPAVQPKTQEDLDFEEHV